MSLVFHAIKSYIKGFLAVFLILGIASAIFSGSASASDIDPAVKMSKRESQVLKLLVSGRSNKDISEELEISDKTVSTYKLRLMRKLKAKSIVDLVRSTISFRYNFSVYLRSP